MLDLLHRAWVVIVGWFHPDMAHGVFWGSLLVTFVASVMGKDQQQRLEQGKFGLAAGTSLGGLSGLLKNQSELLVVGFVGSAVGGLVGWLYYLLLAFLVVRFPKLKSLNVFQVGGLEGLQRLLEVQSKENLRAGFNAWSEKFSRMVATTKSALMKRIAEPHWEDEAITVIRSWLTSAVDALALVFGPLTDRREYQSRVTIIVYRLATNDGNAQASGKHWISYAGQLTPHAKDMVFDQSSIGYKVLSQKLPSPYFTTKEIAQKAGQPRADEPSYRPFITFRLNESAILALDWPEELKEDDDYVDAARSLFYSHVTPAIAEVLDSWPRPLTDAVGPVPLPGNAPQPPAAVVKLGGRVPVPATPAVPSTHAATTSAPATAAPATEVKPPNDKPVS